jgi:ABC-type multidrug transport system fused ATPase/permease subunit
MATATALGPESESDQAFGLREVFHIATKSIPFLLPMRKHLLTLLALSALGFLAGLPVLFLFIDLLSNRVLVGEPLTGFEASLLGFPPERFVNVSALGDAERRAVRGVLLWMGLAGFVTVPLFMAGVYYGIWVMQRISQSLRVRLLERIQSLSLRFHGDSRVGDAIYRIYQDSSMITTVLFMVCIGPLLMLVGYGVSLVVVAVFDPRLSLILAVIWLPLLALGSWFSPRLRRLFRLARETNSDLTSQIHESVSGLRVIKAFGAEEREADRFRSQSRRAFDAAFAARSEFALFAILAFTVTSLALVCVEVFLSIQAAHDAATLGRRALLIFGFATWNLLGAFSAARSRAGSAGGGLHQVFTTWGRAQDVAVGMDRAFELLEAEPEVRDAPDAVPLSGLEHEVCFEDLHFAYRPDQPVLRGVDLRARTGTITAIVGNSGAGKSTLVSLLLRLFDPDRGNIRIDGTDLRNFQLATLRSQIAIALQENWLFGTTVRENIRYAVPAAGDEQVREAARVACANRFIEALPEGYDTLLGERGAKLSTGQRQRLSIARALIKDAPILILDEPTAALDAETEMAVLANLARWGRERAIFLVTHRLSTIRRADQIVMLRDGRVAECGTHRELMSLPGGLYRELVELEGEGRDPSGVGAPE